MNIITKKSLRAIAQDIEAALTAVAIVNEA
jgi:hypothetical protein